MENEFVWKYSTSRAPSEKLLMKHVLKTNSLEGDAREAIIRSTHTRANNGSKTEYSFFVFAQSDRRSANYSELIGAVPFYKNVCSSRRTGISFRSFIPKKSTQWQNVAFVQVLNSVVKFVVSFIRRIRGYKTIENACTSELAGACLAILGGFSHLHS